MIPVTHPSTVNTLTGRREMVISVLSSVSGLVPWNDYIPIRFVDSLDTTEGSYGDETYDGFISVTEIDSTGLTPYNEYVPCYVDNTATDAWVTSASGYIPVEHSGYSSLRNIPTLAGTQYGTLDVAVTFGANEDFEVDVEYSSTESSTAASAVLGNSIETGSVAHFQIENSSGAIGVKTPDGTVGWVHGNAHRDGKVHKLAVYRDGNTIGIKLDGTVKASNLLVASSEVVYNVVGALGISTVVQQLFKGQILSIKFTNVTTGAVNNYVFDSGSDLYQMARGGALGGELVANGTFDTTITGWSSNNATNTWEAGKLKQVDNGSFSAAYQAITTVIGKSYTVSVDMTRISYAADLFYLLVSPNTFSTDWANLTRDVAGDVTSAKLELTFTATSTTTVIQLGTGSTNSAYFDNVTVKQLPDNTCQLTNFATSDWESFNLLRSPLRWVAVDGSPVLEIA